MLRKILVPIDFSEASMAALERARGLAQSVGAELLVLHAMEVPVMPMGDLPYYSADLYQELEKTERKRLNDQVEALRSEGVKARGIFHIGNASPTIIDSTRAEQPDLIVMGTHGRQGFSRWFLGSVAERAVRSSPVPVLTVRARAASEAKVA